jgi:hypothetical protein
MMDLFEVTMEITKRITRIFLRDEKGRRPVYGGMEKFQTDPNWRTISCSMSISKAIMGPV